MEGSPASEELKKLNMERKRDLIYDMSRCTGPLIEMLKTWSRQDILLILCMELGKDRKYTGLTKPELIERLLKIVEEKKLQVREAANVSEMQPSFDNDEMNPKRQRKLEEPYSLPIVPTISLDLNSGTPCCRNSACQAKLNREDIFCKRCSCCICRQYDDNKDPSLWLICTSEPPFSGPSCSMSCHLECALRHLNSGILKDRQDNGLEGSFCCVSCGKINDLLKSAAQLPITPCKLENLKDGTGRNCRPKLNGKDLICEPLTKDEEPQAGSSSKKSIEKREDCTGIRDKGFEYYVKRSIEKREDCTGIGDKGFEYYVKVIRRLECDGHIETSFRQKFLTWYSLRATSQQIRIVKVFIDTFTEDPKSLAEQLVDTFAIVISSKRSSTVPAGFCTKLWH